MNIKEKGNKYKCATLYEYQDYIKSTKPLSFVPWNTADSLTQRCVKDRSKIVIKKCQMRKTFRTRKGKIIYRIPKLLCSVPQEVMLQEKCIVYKNKYFGVRMQKLQTILALIEHFGIYVRMYS